MSYTKLFNSILTSTIWVESDRTRIVWITMLALADKHGEVQASAPGLARVAGVPLEDCEAALNKFLSPDKYSRTPDDEGRRIEVIPGGWLLLNHAKYRALASREESQEAAMIRQRRRRERLARNKSVTPRHADVTPSHAGVTQDLHIAEAEAEAEAITHTEGHGADAPGVCGNSDAPAVLTLIGEQNAANAKETAEKQPRKLFTPPSPDEVEAYSREIGYPLNGQGWCDTYAQKGWMVGKNKMKDWRAAVRNWKTNGYTLGVSAAPKAVEPYRGVIV